MLEAMACCRPVISTNVGIAQDVITHERDGYIHEVEDTSGLVKSLVKVAQDPALRLEIGQRARSKMEEGHQWRMRMPKLQSLYEDVLKRHPAESRAYGPPPSRGLAKLHLTLPAAQQRSMVVLYDPILWNLVLALKRHIPFRHALAVLLSTLSQLSLRKFSHLIGYLAKRLYKKARPYSATAH